MPSDTATAIVLSLVLGGLAALLLRALSSSDARRVSRRVQCPLLGQAAECVLVRDDRTGGWQRVAQCSLRRQPGPFPCASQCLRVMDSKPSSARGGPGPAA